MDRLLLLIAAVFFLLRFVHLAADYPAAVRWEDAILTDEGWYAAAAINQHAWGLPLLSGDMNTAVLLPVWPLLAHLAFYSFGVHIAVLRALAVVSSMAVTALSAVLLRRYGGGRWVPLFLLLCSVNPWMFAISRGAFLESPMLVFALAALLLAQREKCGPRLPAYRLLVAGLLLGIALLTKSSALLMVPVVAFALAQSEGLRSRAFLRSSLLVALPAGALVLAFYAIVTRHFRTDALFYLSTLPAHTATGLHALLAQITRPVRYGAGADHLLFLLDLVLLAASFTPSLRALWREPLFALAGAWIAVVMLALVVANNVMVHYFALLLPPLLLLAVSLLFHPAVTQRWRNLLVLLLALDACGNAVQVIWMVCHPTYTVQTAAEQIGSAVHRDAQANHVVLGDNAHELALYTDMAPVNLFAHAAYVSRQVQRFHPDWWLAYSPEDDGSCYRALLSQGYTAQQQGSWAILHGRTLVLYRLRPVAGASLPNQLTAAEQQACRSPYVARQRELPTVPVDARFQR